MKQEQTKCEVRGTLPSGMEWHISPYTGEIMVYGENAAGNMEWLVPLWSSLDEADQDAIIDHAQEAQDMKETVEAWAKEYGENWMYIACVEDDGLEEWRGLNYEEGLQAMANANNPSFYGGEDRYELVRQLFGELEDMDDDDEWFYTTAAEPGDGWFGCIVMDLGKDAAWDELERLLAETPAEEENA